MLYTLGVYYNFQNIKHPGDLKKNPNTYYYPLYTLEVCAYV